MSPVAQTRALSKVLGLAAEVFQVPESNLAAASSPDTIESWDSLHHLTFVVALEQEFNIQFSPEEIEQLLSIELAAALVDEKAKGREISDGY
ncbi:MAG: hypothetical protein JWO71_1852 [Candidatus Acidoferrum typicum]|nr:hypothetical protein [Candidatus Acidoferrum typicum]